MRFIAISWVVLFHAFNGAGRAVESFHGPDALEALPPGIACGGRGVRLFFVISGFIIALPFVRKLTTGEGQITLRNYYLRRVTRLEPPYLVALVGLYAMAVIISAPEVDHPGFVASFFLRLFYAHGLVTGAWFPMNAATWSLEIEIQFYIIAPLIAQVFRLKPLLRRALLVGGVFLLPRLVDAFSISMVSVVAWAHFFLVGFLLADLYLSRGTDQRVPRWVGDIVGVVALAHLVFLPWGSLFDHLYPWLIGLVCWGALRGGVFKAVLSWPPFTIIGGMCYSIYLIHNPLFSFLASQIIQPAHDLMTARWIMCTVGIAIVLFLGTIFYLLVERPCMNPAWPRRLWGFLRRLFRPGSSDKSTPS